jgi:anti-anti-sigma factor
MSAEVPQLDLTVQATGGRVRVTVRGELDLGTVDVLVDAVAPHARSTVLELDVGGVTFLDAAGIGALVRCQHAVRAQGGRLRLVDVSPVVRRVIDLAGLEGAFDLSAG